MDLRMLISVSMISPIPGRWTLIATGVPSVRKARWTWAIDADATGVSSMVQNQRSISGQFSSRIVRTSEKGMGFTRSCSFLSSSISSGGSSSVLVLRICPNFTNVGPRSSSASRILS